MLNAFEEMCISVFDKLTAASKNHFTDLLSRSWTDFRLILGNYRSCGARVDKPVPVWDPRFLGS